MGKFLLILVLVAAAIYAVLWAWERRRAARGAVQRRVVGPDDDEDFLRWLDRKGRSSGQGRKPGSAPHGDASEKPDAGPAPDEGQDPSPEGREDGERDPRE